MKKTKMKKVAKNNTTKDGTESFSRFRFLIFVLLCLILIILFRFIYSAKNEAEADVLRQIEDGLQINIREATMDLNKIMAAGSVAAGMFEDDGVDYSHWLENVNYIHKNVDNVYMVSIVDNDGKGVCSLQTEYIDIKGYDYFRLSDTAYFTVVPNDGITKTSAIVCVVPIKNASEICGYVCEYINVKDFRESFPLVRNETSNGIFLIEQNGNIISRNGMASKITNENFYDILLTSDIDNADVMKLRTASSPNQNFRVSINNKKYLAVMMPMNLNGWLCVELIDDDYYSKVIKSKNANEIKLVGQLVVLCFLTVLFITIAMLRNRIRDVQTNKALEDKADTDLLTGLNNKIATERKIVETLAHGQQEQHLLILFDIDNFKKINDTMGHAFGDQVIKTLGEQLRQEFRKTDVLGRTGGDEFTLLIKDLKSDELVIKECDKITSFFSDFRVGEYVKYSATASIGVAVFPKDGTSFEELYHAADKALYEAKKLGKNRLVYANKALMKQSENIKKAHIVQGEEK